MFSRLSSQIQGAIHIDPSKFCYRIFCRFSHDMRPSGKMDNDGTAGKCILPIGGVIYFTYSHALDASRKLTK